MSRTDNAHKRKLVMKQYNTVDTHSYLYIHLIPEVGAETLEIVLPKGTLVQNVGTYCLKEIRRLNDSDFREFQDFFLTKDEERLIAIGNPLEKVEDVLAEGETIYIGYGFNKGIWYKIETLTEEVKAFYEAVVNGRENEVAPPKTERECYYCKKSTDNLERVQIGLRDSRICKDCMSLPIHKCIKCFRHRARITRGFYMYEGSRVLRALCEDNCFLDPKRRCSYCTIPMEHIRQCGRCQKITYCSINCQKKDWPEHRINCS